MKDLEQLRAFVFSEESLGKINEDTANEIIRVIDSIQSWEEPKLNEKIEQLLRNQIAKKAALKRAIEKLNSEPTDKEILELAIKKCEEINQEEINKIFGSTYPTDFLQGFIEALKIKNEVC